MGTGYSLENVCEVSSDWYSVDDEDRVGVMHRESCVTASAWLHQCRRLATSKQA